MIETLGSSPLSSVVSAGRSEFISIFRNKPSKAFGEDPNRYPRPYTTTRGIIIDKEFLDRNPIDLNKGYQFQFNPQTISDVKSTLYETRGYAGLPYNDYIWSGGGERIISFQLFLDDTPQSHTQQFRPTAYGSKLADSIKISGKGFTYDKYGRITGTQDKSYLGKGIVDEIVSQGKSIKESFLPSPGPSAFEYDRNGAFSHSRINQRGILPAVELIQSFLYPKMANGKQTPLFAEGGVVNTDQFRPPATVVLAIGPMYLEGVVKSAPVQYTLFDQDLTPLRGTIDIEFAVFEFEDITRKIDYTATKGL